MEKVTQRMSKSNNGDSVVKTQFTAERIKSRPGNFKVRSRMYKFDKFMMKIDKVFLTISYIFRS